MNGKLWTRLAILILGFINLSWFVAIRLPLWAGQNCLEPQRGTNRLDSKCSKYPTGIFWFPLILPVVSSPSSSQVLLRAPSLRSDWIQIGFSFFCLLTYPMADSWFVREFLTPRRLAFNVIFYGLHFFLFAYGWHSQVRASRAIDSLLSLKYHCTSKQTRSWQH